MIRPEMIARAVPTPLSRRRPIYIRPFFHLRRPVFGEDASSSLRERDPIGGTAGRDPSAGIRVVLAARVRLYREGLRDALDRHRAFVVLAECATVEELLLAVAADPPEVVILDMSFCEDRAVARELLAVAPAAKVLALAVDDRHPESVLDCAAAGMAGWVGTEATVEELARAVEHVARGELMCSARHAALLFGKVGGLLTRSASAAVAPTPLTAREREVGVLLARGLSNKGISRSLGIGIATVKNHVHNILGKLEVSSRAEAGGRLIHTLRSDLSTPARK